MNIVRIAISAALLGLAHHAEAGTIAPASNGGPVTIAFNHLASGSFGSYIAGRFEVKAKPSMGWVGRTDFGDPSPCLWFNATGGATVTKSVIVIHEGNAFTFRSVAVYSSTTKIPYTFRGSLNGLTQYVVRGTVPNTFGAFATVTNPSAGVRIDRLVISITNPASISNPEALDNIVVQPVIARVKGNPG